MEQFGPLISTDWLADNLGKEGLKIIDGSWRMPGSEHARDDFKKRHIPGAVFFDLDEIADRRTDLPHMLPPPELFEKEVAALGISHKDRVVVYDDQGVFSAARIWWTFRAMGHGDAAVLDGGLPKWTAENRPVTDAPASPKPAYYAADPVAGAVCTASDVRRAIHKGDALILDARPAARFEGAAPEPRDGLRSGSMPGARNLPHSLLLKDNGALRGRGELQSIFEDAGVDHETAIITTCGSGVTAALLSFALDYIGHRRHRLYDGSWAEWGDKRYAESEYPVDAGKNRRQKN